MVLLRLVDTILKYAPKVFNTVRPYLTKKTESNPLSHKDVEHVQSQIKSATKGNK